MTHKKLKIALIAGEDSGDLLGSYLISEIKLINPEIEFVGVGGDKMLSQGMKLIESNQAFAIMGFTEVLKSLPKLLKLRKKIVQSIIDEKPDLFVGIDAPDLNFPIEKKLKAKNIKIVHYVSPSIWAWREKRAIWISQLTDLVLTLFPFEPKYYHRYDGRAEFVGHPLAEGIDLEINKPKAKRLLELNEHQFVLAILPGSRWSEIKKHTEIFIQTAKKLHDQNQQIQLISANTSDDKIEFIQSIASQYELDIKLYSNATQVLKAADQALLASGTVALEAMLCKTPMVVSYQISTLTYFIVKAFKMLKLPYYSLPNVLYGDFLVPEVLQKEMTVTHLLEALKKQNQSENLLKLSQEFTRLHKDLLTPKLKAAHHVLELMNNE